MILDLTQKRLLKEGLIALHRQKLFQAGMRVFVTCLPDDLDDLAESVGLLHDAKTLPWPSKDCVLICPMMADNTAIPSLVLMRRSSIGPSRGFYDAAHGLTVGEITHLDVVAVGLNENALHTVGPGPMNVTHCVYDSPEAMRREVDVDMGGVFRAIPAVLRQKMLPKGPAAWLTLTVKNDEYFLHHPDNLLPALAILSFPAGYLVSTEEAHGFGPSSMRRQTRGMKIYTMVPANRLHALARTQPNPPDDDEDEDVVGHASPHAHARRAHWMYFWHKAGLNRADLPLEIGERKALALKHQVKFKLRKGCWVGPREMKDADGQMWRLEEEFPE